MRKLNIFLFTVVTLLFFHQCTEEKIDPTPEDYQRLFPFKGIDQPEDNYEDLKIRPCNPRELLEKIKYPGVEISEGREYTIRIQAEYSIEEGSEEEDFLYTDYSVRFFSPEGEILIVGNKENSDYLLEEGNLWKDSFRVKSGYPMYLSVNGRGPRGSIIKASIEAVADDGIVVIPKLRTQHTQNQEGPTPLNDPYCNYIILP